MRPRALLVTTVLALAPACASPPGSGGAPVSGHAAPAPTAPAAPPGAGAVPAVPPAAPAPAASAKPPAGEPCGALGCRSFDKPEQAFAQVLEPRPRMLAVGETHAQKGTEGVVSATRRFTEQLLPLLAGGASDLVIELWIADSRCGKSVAKVEQQQKAVTETQAESNQNEFVTLGTEAKRLGVQPHALRPTCEEYEQIVRAGPDGIDRMLSMIARATAGKAKDLLARNAPDKMVVAYGGALHNDIAPRQGREHWSFGPEMSTHTAGKYVEIDLIVPEFIKDTDSWRALPWYAHYDKEKHGSKAVLFNPGPGAYVLVFPRSR